MDFKEQLEKAYDLLTRNDFREAAKLFQEILKTEPNHAAALRGMGLIALEVENVEAAEDFISST